MNGSIRVLFWTVPLAFLAGCASVKCEGYPQAVCNKCGENPTEVRIIKRMNATGISKLALKTVSHCINAYLNARVKDADFSLNGCISKTSELDEKTRDLLIRIVDDAVTSKDLAKPLAAWERCYSETLGS